MPSEHLAHVRASDARPRDEARRREVALKIARVMMRETMEKMGACVVARE